MNMMSCVQERNMQFNYTPQLHTYVCREMRAQPRYEYLANVACAKYDAYESNLLCWCVNYQQGCPGNSKNDSC